MTQQKTIQTMNEIKVGDTIVSFNPILNYTKGKFFGIDSNFFKIVKIKSERLGLLEVIDLRNQKKRVVSLFERAFFRLRDEEDFIKVKAYLTKKKEGNLNWLSKYLDTDSNQKLNKIKTDIEKAEKHLDFSKYKLIETEKELNSLEVGDEFVVFELSVTPVFENFVITYTPIRKYMLFSKKDLGWERKLQKAKKVSFHSDKILKSDELFFAQEVFDKKYIDLDVGLEFPMSRNKFSNYDKEATTLNIKERNNLSPLVNSTHRNPLCFFRKVAKVEKNAISLKDVVYSRFRVFRSTISKRIKSYSQEVEFVESSYKKAFKELEDVFKNI